MAKDKDDNNKLHRRPVDYDRIASGEKKTPEQIEQDGPIKREGETHLESVKRREQEPRKVLTFKEKIEQERQKESSYLKKDTEKDKEHEHEKDKE